MILPSQLQKFPLPNSRVLQVYQTDIDLRLYFCIFSKWEVYKSSVQWGADPGGPYFWSGSRSHTLSVTTQGGNTSTSLSTLFPVPQDRNIKREILTTPMTNGGLRVYHIPISCSIPQFCKKNKYILQENVRIEWEPTTVFLLTIGYKYQHDCERKLWKLLGFKYF